MNSIRRKEMTVVQKNIQSELQYFEQLSYADNENLFEILHNKCKGLPLRGYFAYKLFHYIKEENKKVLNENYIKFFEQQLPFILEAIISIQYYHNQILDGKAGVTTPDKINHNLVIGNLFKDQLYRYIEQLKINKPDLKALKACVRSIFEYVDIGQYIEKKHNTYQAYQENDSNHPFKEKVNNFIDLACIDQVSEIALFHADTNFEKADISFLNLYLHRIYLTNATLFKLATKFITDVLKTNSEIKKRIIKFSTFTGMMFQIMNDNCDLVPSRFEESTITKTYNDAFSDLKNFNVTLPILIHMKRFNNGYIANFLSRKNRKILEYKFFQEIKEYLSIYKSIRISRLVKEIAICHLNNKNSHYNEIADMLGVVDRNRYYNHFFYDSRNLDNEKGVIKRKKLKKLLLKSNHFIYLHESSFAD